jgi:hypothetical protein
MDGLKVFAAQLTQVPETKYLPATHELMQKVPEPSL